MPEVLNPPGEVEEKNEGDTPAAKPMVGIIYPPPEVRSILLIHVIHLHMTWRLY